MNLELLESFGQNYPEDFDGTLDCMSVAITCQFNRRGTLLAVGCNDGRIIIWDFLTRGIAKVISAHVHPVCSLSWNRSGYKLLSASTDNNVCIWNVVSGDCLIKYKFPSPFIKVQFNPRDDTMFLVCLLKYASLVVKQDGTFAELPLDDANEPNVISSFDRKGEYIFCGNAKGKISIFEASTHKLMTSFRVTNGSVSSSAIKQIEFARRGSSFLVSTADRIIRVYDTIDVFFSSLHSSKTSKHGSIQESEASTIHCPSDPEPLQKLQDLVNRTLWKKCCFSGDGEYICAGSSRQHSLYIWEKNVGNLVKILHGTKGELLLDVVWHPVRPLIASVSSGVVSIWSQNQVENWSAFAPDFKELDENVEYEERESEFDLEDEDKSVHASKGNEEEEIDVDLTVVQPIQAFLSSDEEGDEDHLLFLTITPEFDEVECDMSADNNDMPPPSLPSDDKFDGVSLAKVSTTNSPSVCYEMNLPNAPISEIHPFNVKSKRQNPPTAKDPNLKVAKNASKKSSTKQSKSNKSIQSATAHQVEPAHSGSTAREVEDVAMMCTTDQSDESNDKLEQVDVKLESHSNVQHSISQLDLMDQCDAETPQIKSESDANINQEFKSLGIESQ